MEDDSGPPATKKRRIPKACAACRRSKLRCDERRPCSRCVNTKTDCVYVNKPVDPMTERLEALEAQVSNLTQRLEFAASSASPSVVMGAPRSVSGSFGPGRSLSSVSESGGGPKRLACFTVRQVSTIDVIDRGLVSDSDARSLFNTFFQGYVAVYLSQSKTSLDLS